MLPYIEIFGKIIPWYGILMVLGFGVAGVVAVLICKRNGIEQYDLVYSAVYTVIGAMLGAKLLFIIVEIPNLISGKYSLLDMLQGGFVFYGGLIGGILGLWIYCKQYHLEFSRFGDVYATVVPLGHAFGRVGCFMGGCCYGMEYDGPLHYVYQYRFKGSETPLGVPLLPVQLIEATVLLIVFVGMLLLYFRKGRRVWDQVIYYATAYAVIRFTLEFFRGDAARGSLLFFSTSQWISLALFAFAVIIIVLRSKKTSAAQADEAVDSAPQ